MGLNSKVNGLFCGQKGLYPGTTALYKRKVPIIAGFRNSVTFQPSLHCSLQISERLISRHPG